MQRTRFDHWLASAAVAAALTLAGTTAPWAQSAPSAVDAAVPVPDTTLLPPPTAADVSVPATSGSAGPADTPAPAAIETPAPAQTAAPIAAPKADPAPVQATAPAAPAPVVASGDAAIAEKLRELSGSKFDRVLGRRDRPAVEAFYNQRQFAPLWITQGALNERGRAVIAYLGRVEADGLEPGDYSIPEFKGLSEPDALADAEIKLTDAVLTYARHAQMGRVHYTRIAADIEFDLKRPDPADVLSKLAQGPVAAALDGLQPQHAGYKALKAKLAQSRGQSGDAAAPRVPHGPALRYAKDKKGKETILDDSRVPMLRDRLEVPGDKASTAYDKAVADAVSKLQKERGLPVTGRLTDATVDAINGPRRDRDADIIIANMDRWRWMPRDLGGTHVIVNIPDYTLRVMRDGKQVWKTNIVVGKPSQATPIMTGEMKFITVNPTWNVPPSIIKNEYLPALASDPTVLSRMGLKIAHNSDGTVRIWQPPGDRNALGRIRFNFPNKFLVYQHDTPDKNLFAHARRAYSHGCMRVEDPLKYGEVLLSLVRPNDGYSADRLRKMFGSGEININFPKNIPVHLTYQTAFVDDAGKLVIREDIYSRDTRMIAQMKGSERRVADVAMDRPRNTSAVPVRAARGTVPGATGGDGRGFGGPSFFDRLFGGGYEETPAPRQRGARSARSER